MPKDLLNPTKEEEKRTHKLKRLVPYPNSFFMDVKCSGCMQITTVFSHAQTIVMCPSCSQKLCERELLFIYHTHLPKSITNSYYSQRRKG